MKVGKKHSLSPLNIQKQSNGKKLSGLKWWRYTAKKVDKMLSCEPVTHSLLMMREHKTTKKIQILDTIYFKTMLYFMFET